MLDSAEQLKKNYIAKLESQRGKCQYVDVTKVKSLSQFLGGSMGKAVGTYFDNMAVQPDGRKGLNYYKLSHNNYLTWLAIKIVAGSNTHMYECSVTLNNALWQEMLVKSQPKQQQRRR